MDINFARRKRERAIASEVEQQFLREVTSTTVAAPPDLLAHHFATVCQRLAYIPNPGSTGRILGYVSKSLAQKHRALAGLADSIDRMGAAADHRHDASPR